MSAGGLRRRKLALRAWAHSARDGLSEEDRARGSEAIARTLLALPVVARAAHVMVFSSFGSEVGTSPILEGLSSRGARVILPRVEGSDIEAVAFHPGDPVRRARYGALEPSGGAVVPPDEIDVVIVPGLAFDRRGYRVGYGGGFYDRFLRRLRPDAVAIGVGFSAQVVEEVPHDSDDKPVDMVVTEQGIVGPNDGTSVGRA